MYQILSNVDSNYICHYHKCELGDSIAFMEKTGISFCRFFWESDIPEIIYIRDLSVKKEERNKKVGTHLLNIVESVCKSIDVKVCRTPVIYNSKLMFFRKKHGYSYDSEAEDNIVWLNKIL